MNKIQHPHIANIVADIRLFRSTGFDIEAVEELLSFMVRDDDGDYAWAPRPDREYQDLMERLRYRRRDLHIMQCAFYILVNEIGCDGFPPGTHETIPYNAALSLDEWIVELTRADMQFSTGARHWDGSRPDAKEFLASIVSFTEVSGVWLPGRNLLAYDILRDSAVRIKAGDSTIAKELALWDGRQDLSGGVPTVYDQERLREWLTVILADMDA